MKWVKIMLKNGKELEIIVKQEIPTPREAVMYIGKDNRTYTIVTAEIAVLIEENIE